jgi:murein DD-endopeptidase MepM/ murein hydrolase activator NlpD
LLALAVLIAALGQASLIEPLPLHAAPVTRGSQTSALLRRASEIERAKARARRQLQRAKSRQRVARRDLQAVESNLRAARDRLISTKARLAATQAELRRANRNLAAAQARLRQHRAAASDRLVDIYEQGPVRYLDVLTSAVSFADFANRLYLLQLVVEQDVRLMREMERDRARIGSYRRQVQSKERSVAALEVAVARRHEEFADQREDQARLVSDLARQRAYWERALAQMEQDSRDIAAQIRRYQHTQGRARYSTPWRGSFMRPVAGGITSGFGYRMHPILGVRKMHTGVDISAATGAPIRAGDAGTVIWSGRRGGYGLCVVIDHGGGMSTVYGHCSRLACSVGQEVRKGEVIGYVGSTGLSTGPHLHFEVRRNGSPIAPF